MKLAVPRAVIKPPPALEEPPMPKPPPSLFCNKTAQIIHMAKITCIINIIVIIVYPNILINYLCV